MPKRLVRDTRRGVIGGVAAGFGLYLDVDPVLVRLALVLLTFAHGLGILLYLAGWLLMPRAEGLETAAALTGTASAAPEAVSGAAGTAVGTAAEGVQATVGGLLVVIGGVVLAHNLGWLHWPWWMSFGTLWPVVLVALGVGLILKSRRPETERG